MKTAAAIVCSAYLLVPAVDAAEPCSGDVAFGPEGAIERWSVCYGQLEQQFAASGSPKLEMQLLVGGTDADLDWRRTATDGAFEATDPAHAVEVRRRYEMTDANSVVHSVVLRNLSGQPLSMELLIRPGRIPQPDTAVRSLAELVYSFERTEIESADGGWEPAADGGISSRFAITSRHKLFVLEAERPFVVREFGGRSGEESAGEWQLVWREKSVAAGSTVSFIQKVSALPTTTGWLSDTEYAGLMYADLWGPLAALSRWTERLLSALSSVAAGPAFAIALFAVGIRLVTLPISLWSARRQRDFLEVSARMKPRIEQAKANHRGADQSERILAIYKEHGISPFSGLKGSLGLFVQIPFLLAVFNVTTASALFAGAGFLWIDDLSLPDTAALLPFAIPLLGSQVNLLPIALGVVNVASLKGQDGARAGKMSVMVTLLIVFLFYSFAAAVVLYWLTVNVLQAGERMLLRHLDGPAGGQANERAPTT